jgi:hypothetical protein
LSEFRLGGTFAGEELLIKRLLLLGLGLFLDNLWVIDALFFVDLFVNVEVFGRKGFGGSRI